MNRPEAELEDDVIVDAAAAEQEGGDADDSSEGDEKQPLELQLKIDSPSACERHVTVTIARDDIERYFNDAFSELMPTAQVPGFRAGRAPRKLVEKSFRKQVGEQVKGSLLMDALSQISNGDTFSAISEPDFDFEAIVLPDEGPMKFEFDIEVRPDFDLPKWKGLSLEKPVKQFGKEDVDLHLEKILGRFGEMETKDAPAETRDYVLADFVFRHDGKEISHLDGELVRVLPKLSFPDGQLADFDKLMAGAKPGDTKVGKATISEGAENEELRGKEIEATVRVNEVKQMKLPELNGEFLARIGGYGSEGELRDVVLDELERQLRYHQQRRVREQITNTLTEAANWDLPPSLLKRQSRRELERAVLELQRSGFSEAEVRQYENELRQNVLASTARALKEHFILERIAEEEKIDASPDDYDAEIRLIAAQMNDSPRRVRARLEKRGAMDTLRNQIIERKVIELISDSAAYNEVPFQAAPQDTEAIDFPIATREAADIPEAKYGEESPLNKLPGAEGRG